MLESAYVTALARDEVNALCEAFYVPLLQALE
jgi:hypothetical protein